MTALFFDTETTGIKTWQNPDFVPGLVQLGAILQDLDTGRVVAEVNLICRQPEGESIPAEASKVHGITDDIAAKYGVDVTLIDAVFVRLGMRADVIVAHNLPYDTDVVVDNLPTSAGHLFGGTEEQTAQPFDTMQANVYIVQAPLSDKQIAYFNSKGKLPDHPFKLPNLTETYQYYFGVPFEGAHDAMADIRACRDIFMEMLKREHIDIAGGGVVYTPQLLDQIDYLAGGGGSE